MPVSHPKGNPARGMKPGPKRSIVEGYPISLVTRTASGDRQFAECRFHLRLA